MIWSQRLEAGLAAAVPGAGAQAAGPPALVMPIQQVLASMPAEPGAYDVVIVDDAERVELTSAFLFWLAPRAIVIADGTRPTPDGSLFSLLRNRFGQVVRLCGPERLCGPDAVVAALPVPRSALRSTSRDSSR